MGGFARRGMVGETPPDPLRFEGTLSGSSTGWTDEKHMLYIRSLELSFVTKLYDGEVNSNGLFCWSHDGNHRNTEVNQQVYCGMVEADRAESRVSQAEHTESPSCDGDQDERKAHCMDDDASTSDPRQEGVRYYERRKNFGGSSTSYFHWHGHSLSGTTELSDQNFVDDETKIDEEQRRVCTSKRLKHTANTTSSPAAPSANGNSQRETIHHVEADYSGSSSDFNIGLLDVEPASCKSHGSRRWSV